MPSEDVDVGLDEYTPQQVLQDIVEPLNEVLLAISNGVRAFQFLCTGDKLKIHIERGTLKSPALPFKNFKGAKTAIDGLKGFREEMDRLVDAAKTVDRLEKIVKGRLGMRKIRVKDKKTKK